MLGKLKKTQSEGFTIIEVMIVLAIAAIILVIVLLAVPALQRNSRNTTIKNDANTVAGLINTAEGNSDGKTPTALTFASPNVTITDTTSEKGTVSGGTTVKSVIAVPTPPVGEVDVYFGYDCNAAATNARAVSVYYVTESSSGASGAKCILT